MTKPFFYYVKKTETCWLWQGYIRDDGYGRYKGKVAHRYHYEMVNGPLPPEKILHHMKEVCSSRRCVRLDHLMVTDNRHHPDAGGTRNELKIACRWGHPFNEENTYYHPISGWRMCRTCQKIAARRFRFRNKKKKGVTR
jgi:HNH endonuclease